jgi:cytochrome oxidase Cu insertion factor (SCO1/SenC/PrrC family)
MILRSLASLVLIALFGLNWMLPSLPGMARGPENRIRADVSTGLALGQSLPPFSLTGLDGREYTLDDLLGHRVLLTFERSVDW